MLRQAAVLDPDNVRGDPGNRRAVSGETAVDDYVVALGDDELMLVTQRVGCVADQIEQSIATRFDVRAVLNVVRRPILLRGRVVALVKQCVEGLENQRFVFLLYRLTNNCFLVVC